MKQLGLPFSGLNKSTDGMYSLAYSDFVMPLVNAVKEQQIQINELKKQLQAASAFKQKLEAIEKRMASLEESKMESFDSAKK